jgi:hypothetical protein
MNVGQHVRQVNLVWAFSLQTLGEHDLHHVLPLFKKIVPI